MRLSMESSCNFDFYINQNYIKDFIILNDLKAQIRFIQQSSCDEIRHNFYLCDNTNLLLDYKHIKDKLINISCILGVNSSLVLIVRDYNILNADRILKIFHYGAHSVSRVYCLAYLRSSICNYNVKSHICKGARFSKSDQKVEIFLADNNSFFSICPSVFIDEDTANAKHSAKNIFFCNSSKFYLNTKGLSQSIINSFIKNYVMHKSFS